MNNTVRTFETDYNTYYVGYGRTAKTSLEQRREHKEYMKRMLIKALVITGLIIICILSGLVSTELIIPITLIGILGIAAVLTNNLGGI